MAGTALGGFPEVKGGSVGQLRDGMEVAIQGLSLHRILLKRIFWGAGLNPVLVSILNVIFSSAMVSKVFHSVNWPTSLVSLIQ